MEPHRFTITRYGHDISPAAAHALRLVNTLLDKKEEDQYMEASPKPTPKGPKVYEGEFMNDRELAAEKDRPEEEGEVEAKEGAEEGFADYDDREPETGGDGDGFAPETDGDFNDKPIGEHSRTNPNAPPAEKKPSKIPKRR